MIYLFYWLLFSAFSLVEVNVVAIARYKRLLRVLGGIMLFMIIFLVGFRWRTGTDWEPYYNFFVNSYGRGFFEPDSYMSYGYVLFNNAIYWISESYTLLLLIHSLIFYYCIYKSYQFFTPYVILTFFIYATIYIGVTGSHRQLMAVAIGFLGLTQYLQGKKRNAIIALIAAVLFHSSAVLLLIYPFLMKRMPVKYIFLAFIFGAALGQTGLMLKLFSVFGSLGDASEGKIDAYANATGAQTSLSVVGIVRRIVTVGLLMYYANNLRNRYKYFDLCLNSYLFTVLAFVLFSSVPIIAGRGMLFFNVMEPILLVYLVSLLDKYRLEKLGYVLLCLLLILFFFQSINIYPGLFIPYQGIFINEDFYREMN